MPHNGPVCGRLTALIVLGCALATGAYARQSRSPSAPTFSTGVSLQLVDLRVTDRDEPVRDLTRDELVLLVDDLPRPIVSLIPAPVVSASSIPPAAGRNGSQPGVAPARRIVFVVDRESLNSNEVAQLRSTAEDFVGQLPDNVAIS